jgi:Permuted papain-like amidase enzyme, YaeF/YiiX, C92 family
MTDSVIDDRRTVSGLIERTVGDNLAYVLLSNGRSLPFTTELLDRSVGRTLSDLQLKEGSQVTIQLGSDEHGIIDLELRPPVAGSDIAIVGSDSLRLVPDIPAAPPLVELQPQDAAASSYPVARALPPKTRAFGRLLDTTDLWPGDLILTRSARPDYISRIIRDTQVAGGYSDAHARWSHAAIYLGDDLSVVEATFESFVDGSVRVTPLDEYCQGDHALRIRRPYVVTSERQGWRICLRALRRLGHPYQYLEALRAWWAIRFGKKDFGSEDLQRGISQASLCSTLYADSVAEALRQMLGEVNGWCTPAWLSASLDFRDLNMRWIGIT